MYFFACAPLLLLPLQDNIELGDETKQSTVLNLFGQLVLDNVTTRERIVETRVEASADDWHRVIDAFHSIIHHRLRGQEMPVNMK